MGSQEGAREPVETRRVGKAPTALYDTMSVTGADMDHSVGEFRFIAFGLSQRGRLLVVSHSEEDDDTIRIVSARTASKRERRIYEEG